MIWWVFGLGFLGILAIILYDVIKKQIIRSKREKLRYEKEIVKVSAVRVEFISPKKATLFNWKSHPAKYNVYYAYGFQDNRINNQKLYKKVVNGEKTFDIIVHRGYDGNGIQRYQYHTLKKE